MKFIQKNLFCAVRVVARIDRKILAQRLTARKNREIELSEQAKTILLRYDILTRKVLPDRRKKNPQAADCEEFPALFPSGIIFILVSIRTG